MKSLKNVMIGLGVLGIVGCGTIVGLLNHFVGSPEPSPPLGTPFSVGLSYEGMANMAGEPGQAGGEWMPSEPAITLNPATDAATADMAGIWIHAEGLGAVHIDDTGSVFQVDLSEQVRDYLQASILPLTLFRVGTITVGPDGNVEGELSVSLPPLHATATITGTLDETHNVLYAVRTHATFNDGTSSYSEQDHTPWLRWDPNTDALAMDN